MPAQAIILNEIHANLPRLLACFDVNPASSSLGYGDRFHWGWKLIDFPNATFQGAVHGLAILATGDMLPETMCPKAIITRCDEIVASLGRLTRPDGSLEEAFPFEASFCVTSLVAHDVLAALEALDPHLTDKQKARWQQTVAPLIAYTIRADESHGIISNHLATAAAALFRWAALADTAQAPMPAHALAQRSPCIPSRAAAEEKGCALIDRILAHQSPEGWFSEYGGADPGYQTLCIDFLATVHKARPDLQLEGPLRCSLQFLWHFAHPDGSFAGLYGHRNTRVYQPGGIAQLADQFPEAAALTQFMLQAIARRACVGLSAIDPPNLGPMFNSYCNAAAALAGLEKRLGGAPPVPCGREGNFHKHFDHAGIIIDKDQGAYTIINWKKGGTVARFPLTESGTPGAGGTAVNDAGVLGRAENGGLVSTQGPGGAPTVEIDCGNLAEGKARRITVRTQFTEVLNRCPGVFDFFLLRGACLTVMRFSVMREWIKRAMVRLLMTKERTISAWNVREITLAPDFSIRDSQDGKASIDIVQTPRGFIAIHGATQGYWQVSDDAPFAPDASTRIVDADDTTRKANQVADTGAA